MKTTQRKSQRFCIGLVISLWDDKCSESIMQSRSGWILRNQDGCIYVNNKMPPPGKNKAIPYLTAQTVKVPPPLP